MKKLLCCTSVVFLSTMLFGCASHEVPHPSSTYITGNYKAEKTLAGKKLYMVMAEGNQDFSKYVNDDFVGSFEHGGIFHFAQSNSNKLFNVGEYHYNIDSNDNKEANLTLNVHSGKWESKSIAMHLKFQTENSGVYTASVQKGGTGTQSGIFEIQYI